MRCVVITGAAGRLGQVVARRFQEAGVLVAAVVRNEQDTERLSFLKQGGGRIFFADVSVEADVVRCFRQIGTEAGLPDALVHTVGTWDGRPLLETSMANWEQQLRVNLTSAFLCFREAARLMQGRPGRLIGIASGQGADRGRGQQGAYSAAKAGVIRLVEAVAEEFAGTGLTAHAIAPSMILYDEVGEQQGVSATHLADLCLSLCTDAGATLNGATLRAYGR